MKPTKEINMFKHTYDINVKFEEVDMLHIVNNAVYFNYLEQARIKYARDLELLPKNGVSPNGTAFYMARNEINYLKVATFEDNLRVFTRVSFMKNSSFGFEHIIKNIDNDKIIAEGSGILVHVNPSTKESVPLPQEFYKKIDQYEGGVNIIKEN